MATISAQQIGNYGELYVKALLPNARWRNKNGERREDYDLCWRGIHIDVKTSFQKLNKTAFTFATINKVKRKGTIIVFVGFYSEEVYLWVKGGDYAPSGFYGSIRKSFSPKELASKILEICDT